MSKFAKIVMSLTLVALVTGGTSLWQSIEAKRPEVVSCTVDIVHTTRAQDGTVLGTEFYSKDFVLSQGTDLSDDYSTPTRFKFFNATLQEAGGAATVAIDWFADVSVFNSADFSTALTLIKGQKQGDISASHTFSSTPGHSTTTYTLTASRR